MFGFAESSLPLEYFQRVASSDSLAKKERDNGKNKAGDRPTCRLLKRWRCGSSNSTILRRIQEKEHDECRGDNRLEETTVEEKSKSNKRKKVST